MTKKILLIYDTTHNSEGKVEKPFLKKERKQMSWGFREQELMKIFSVCYHWHEPAPTVFLSQHHSDQDWNSLKVIGLDWATYQEWVELLGWQF